MLRATRCTPVVVDHLVRSPPHKRGSLICLDFSDRPHGLFWIADFVLQPRPRISDGLLGLAEVAPLFTTTPARCHHWPDIY